MKKCGENLTYTQVFFVYFDPNSGPNFGLTQANFAITQPNFALTRPNFPPGVILKECTKVVGNGTKVQLFPNRNYRSCVYKKIALKKKKLKKLILVRARPK